MNQVSSDVRIDSPPPAEAAEGVEAYWKMLEPSFEYGGLVYNQEELRNDLLSGDVLLIRGWLGETCLSLTIARKRMVYGTPDLLVIATAGTGLRDWGDELMDVFDQLAAEAGCDTITMQTRKGMDKLAKKWGYKLHQIIIRKRVGKPNGR